MPNFNCVILAGHLVRDPEIKVTEKTMIAKSAIAVSEKYKDKEDTCFIDVVFFGKLAEVFGQHCKKGDAILIDGRLKQETWESESGKRSKHVVIAEKMQFLSKKNNTSIDDADIDFAQPKGTKRAKKQEEEVDDLPF